MSTRADRRLTADLVRAWVRDHRARTGSWPRRDGGPVLASPGDTWERVNAALSKGLRGLPGGTTLRALVRQLAEESGEDVPRDPRGGRLDEARRAEAARLRAKGLTLTEIGQRLGCTHQNVSLLLRPPGAKKRPPTKKGGRRS